MLTGEHVPSGFFNAGEKIVFWVGLFLFSSSSARPGSSCSSPISTRGARSCSTRTSCTRSTAVVYVAMMLGHMYLGTVGMEGAYDTMRTTAWWTSNGRRSTTRYWYNEVMAGERAQRGEAGDVRPSRAGDQATCAVQGGEEAMKSR